VDSSQLLRAANFMEKKTGYPQLWSTEGEVILEGEASEA
jgi:hypothetical protein